MPTLQSSFSQNVFSALPGQFAENCSPRRVTTRAARDLIRAGLMCFQVPATSDTAAAKLARGYPGECYQIVTYGTVADDDAIGTITSATGTKTIGSGVTTGVAGASVLSPPRKLTVTCNSSTDWDPTNATLTYVNHLGVTTTETLAIATSTTATTTGYAKQFVSSAVPPQTGSGGSAIIGITAVSSSTLTIKDCVGIAVRQPGKQMHNSTNMYGYPGIASTSPNAHYVDGDLVSLLEIGDIWCETEEALDNRDDVYVRIAAGSGGTQIGAFRNDSDSSTCILVAGARVKRMAASGTAWISFAPF